MVRPVHDSIHFEALFRHLPAGCLVTDEEGTIEEVNRPAEKMLGRHPESLLDKPLVALVSPEDRQFVQGIIHKALVDEPVGEREVQMLGRDSPFPATLHVTGWRAPDGRHQLVWLIHDIARRKELQDRALQMERLLAISKIARGLTHEARNALQLSMCGLEVLAMEVEGRKEAIALVAQIKESQQYLKFLFEKVREYSGPITLELRPADLAEVLEESWSFLAPARDQRDATLAIAPSSIDLECKADRAAIERAFRYLLEGSLRICPYPVRIDATLAPAEVGGQPAVRLTLRDNGPGLTPDERPKVFEPFAKVKALGADLGLAIAKRIIEAHEGTIAVGDRPPPGLVLVLTIPRKPVRGEDSAKTAETERIVAPREESLARKSPARRARGA